jgi:TonB family protein
MKTLCWLLCATALTLPAQTNPDARDLLIHSGDSIFGSNSVRLAGTVTAIAEGIGPRQTVETKFSIALLRNGRWRRESTNGAATDFQVFDGTSLWTYSAVGKTYTQRVAQSSPPIQELAFLDSGRRADKIKTADVDRIEDLIFAGRSITCYVVHAAYTDAPVSPSGAPKPENVTRTAWIAREQNLVLRDLWETELAVPNGRAKLHITTNFSTIEKDAPIPDDVFVFHAPEGSRLASAGPATGTGPGIGGGIGSGTGGGMSLPEPVPIKRVAPEYSSEARAVGLQGSVFVAFDILPEGTVQNARIKRGLGAGLDGRALAAVGQWQYALSMDGRTRALAMVEVPFRLDPPGPWQLDGSSFAVTGPFMPQDSVVKPVLAKYSHPADSLCPVFRDYVVASLEVGADGVPGQVQITSSPDGIVSQAAAAAIQAWRFQPGSVNGEPRSAKGTIVFLCQPLGNYPEDSTTQTLRTGAGVSQPTLIYKVEPEYSEEARKAKWQGTVQLSLIVETSGKPSNVRVVRALGLGLDQQAIEAVQQWRFKPGLQGGKPVRVIATIDVSFRLL